MTRVEEIAKNYGYKYEIVKDGSIISYNLKKIDNSNVETFIGEVITYLYKLNNVVLVNRLEYSNDIEIKFENYKDRITINLDEYIDN